MSTETIEIFNNSDEWANQLKHALSKGENLALLHGLTPDILDRIYAYAFDYHEKGNITDAEIYYKFLCITCTLEEIMPSIILRDCSNRCSIAEYSLAFSARGDETSASAGNICDI